MDEEDKKKYEAQNRANNRKVFEAYASATAIIITSIVVSFFIKKYLIDLSDCKYVILIGTAIPTIGTLSFLGWEIQTYGGDTPPERLNKNLLKLTYIVGIILIILGTKF